MLIAKALSIMARRLIFCTEYLLIALCEIQSRRNEKGEKYILILFKSIHMKITFSNENHSYYW